MCGLAGILNLDGRPVEHGHVAIMTRAVSHRGPDAEGIVADGPVGLGHRRLSILDLSESGNQPMDTPDGRYSIVYNGEIYNFQELRSELEAQGERFPSTSDTAVLLHAIKVWGLKAIERLNGMFAFAVWDRWEKRLVLARDRYGVKPLYYAFVGDMLLFGSEVKALLSHPEFTARMDEEGLAEYIAFQNFFSDRTLFKNVRLFPRGSYAEIRIGSTAELTPIQFWDYHFHEPTHVRKDADYLEEGKFLLRQAVERQLVSDVPVGSYLSGGMDSGSLTAIAANQLPDMRTFTCGFDLDSVSGMEAHFDERASAERLSAICRTEHYEVVLKAGDMERVLPQLAYHLEEPRVGQCYPNYYVAGLASRFVKVVLSGAGGDEIFGGYPWRYYRAIGNGAGSNFVDGYYDFWQRLVPQEQYKAALAPMGSGLQHFSPRDIFTSVYRRHNLDVATVEDAVNSCLYFEASTFLQGLLIVEDKISMAHGMETRVPFLDNDLVDFAQKVPARLKLKNLDNGFRVNENEIDKSGKYFQRTGDGKLLLRQITEGLLPKAFLERPKQGFSAPDASWFKSDSMDFVRERIVHDDARIYEYLDGNVMRGLVEDHLDGRANRRLLIWSLLNLEQVCHAFL